MKWNNRIKASERNGFCLCGCELKTKIAKVTRTERGDIKGLPVRYIYGHNTKDPEWRNRVASAGCECLKGDCMGCERLLKWKGEKLEG